MRTQFEEKVELGKANPGVFIVSQFEPIASGVDVLIIVWAASQLADWHNQIRHLPSLSQHLSGRRNEGEVRGYKAPASLPNQDSGEKE